MPRRVLWLPVLTVVLLAVVTAVRAESLRAAIAMPDLHSARVAEDVLRAGGNAVDAAVAAAFTLAVTHPEGGNIGGGGFMLVYHERDATFLDYRETAPRAAHARMYLDEHGEIIDRLSVVGHRAAGVPGTVAGLWAAHVRYGTLPWKDLIEPAARIARDGFVVPKQLADRKRAAESWYADKTNFADYFGALDAGVAFRQPELAATLTRIAALGAAEFYTGETARLIVEEMHHGDGLIGYDDLKDYRVVWRAPLAAKWREYTVLSAPPPSSGGFAVVQLLKLKDHLAEQFAEVALNSVQYVHLVAEIEKRVFADRAEYLGDPDHVDVPIDALLDDVYLRRRAAEVDPAAISTLAAARPGLEPHDTTHFSIVDRWGNAVSNTYTLNTNFGSGVVVAGAGFLLNNEMDDFSIKPGAPNFYGVVGTAANEVQPGKRMLSSMSPTILLDGDDVAFVLGTPGGPTIFTTIFQVIVNLVDFGVAPAEAVGAPRFHHQLFPPDLITYSPAVPLPPATVAALVARGYRAQPHGFELGDVQLIVRDGDAYDVASDPRGRGAARVLELR